MALHNISFWINDETASCFFGNAGLDDGTEVSE
jgi:hypothetical protein